VAEIGTTERDDEAGKLRRQLTALVHQARRNEDSLARFQRLEIALLAIESLPETLETICNTFIDSFTCDQLSLALVDDDHEIRRCLLNHYNGYPFGDKLLFAEDEETLRPLFDDTLRTRLGRYRGDAHAALFPHAQIDVQSLALVPLMRQQRLIGTLIFASRDPNRYQTGASTIFLDHFGAVMAICVENAVNQERLRHLSLTDTLTAVNNRRFFDQRLDEEVTSALRYGNNLSLMFLDVDYFKRVNDQYGHQVGDLVLRDVARLIKAELRTSDTLARYGGEEFTALLPHSSTDHVAQVAERIRASVEGTSFGHAESEAFQATISIGCATLPANCPKLPETELARILVETADQSVYRAKENGRNRVESAGELQLEDPEEPKKRIWSN
jgi:diguanylate cyclase (GGDEF)-like protein